MADPLISVVVPLYNHERYIEETLHSVLSQGEGDFELIILDDGSLDGSAGKVSAFSDPRIRFYQQKNQGAHNTINRGIQLAKGKYLSILNSDDRYHRDRLARCSYLMEVNSDIDALFTEVECIDEEGKHLYHVPYTLSSQYNTLRSHKDQLLAFDLFGENFLSTTSNLFCRRSVFSRLESFRGFRYCHDWDFFLRLMNDTHVRIIREPLVQYRIHPANTLNEDKARVYFEIAVLLADFLRRHDLTPLMKETDPATFYAQLFRSLHYSFPDRLFAVLNVVDLAPEEWNVFMEELITDSSNPLGIACLEQIRHLLDNNDFHNLVLDENKRLHQEVAKLRNQDGTDISSSSDRFVKLFAGLTTWFRNRKKF